MDKISDIFFKEELEIGPPPNGRYSTNEIRQMNEIMLNFQQSETNADTRRESSAFCNSKTNRNQTKQILTKNSKIGEKFTFDPYQNFFEIDVQNKISDDLNVNLLKYNLTHNNLNNSDIFNNFMTFNNTDEYSFNPTNNFNNLDMQFNNFAYNQNSFGLDKSWENDIMKKIVLDKINKILSGTNIKEKMMLYLSLRSSSKSQYNNDSDMDRLLDLIKPNYLLGSGISNKVHREIIHKTIVNFCKYLKENNCCITKSSSENQIEPKSPKSSSIISNQTIKKKKIIKVVFTLILRQTLDVKSLKITKLKMPGFAPIYIESITQEGNARHAI
jgi:hypothetical protein